MSTWPVSPYSHFNKAEELFKQIDHITPEDKSELISHLKEAYPGVRDVQNWAASILHMCGRCVYGNMEKALPYFLLSLSIQLVALRVLAAKSLPKVDDCSLDKIPEAIGGHSFDGLFAAIEQRSETIRDRALDLDSTQGSLMGKNLRWLGHVLQNLPEHSKPENLSRFEAIYGLAKEIFSMIFSEDARFEGQFAIAYNTTELLYGFRNPGDAEGAFAELMKLRPLLQQEKQTVSVREMLAQLHNKDALRYRRLASQERDEEEKQRLLRESYAAASEAAQRATSIKDGFNTFLKTLFVHNKAKAAMLCSEAGTSVMSDTEIQNELEQVIRCMKQTDYDHYYHVTFLATIVQHELNCENERAVCHLTQALKLCSGKFAESCDEEDGKLLSALVEAVGERPSNGGFFSALEQFEKWYAGLKGE